MLIAESESESKSEARSEAEAAMDVDFWDTQFHSSKLFSGMENSEVNDDAITYFTCPFCYVDTELSLLCNHLQEEHCFDIKNAVCPVCALNLGKDVVGHFKAYHASSNKTRRKSRKSEVLGLCVGRGSQKSEVLTLDSLLSPFLSGIPYLESKSEDEAQELRCANEDLSNNLETESSKGTTVVDESTEEKEIQDSKELRQRAEFCQQLFFSVIL